MYTCGVSKVLVTVDVRSPNLCVVSSKSAPTMSVNILSLTVLSSQNLFVAFSNYTSACVGAPPLVL